MKQDTNQQAITEYLASFISDNKRNRIDEVLALRTNHLTVVLEDIYKPHNASAVLRTCECYGIQNIHVVEQRNTYDVNRYVTRGSAKWVSLHKYDHPNHDNIDTCFRKLKKEGYKIYATSPIGSLKPSDIPVDDKVAVVFGTEETGITDYVKDNADGLVQIPMYGFTESFNISVAAAIVLQSVSENMRDNNTHWQLTDTEKRDLKYEWYKACVNHSEELIRDFEKKNEI